MVLYFWIVFVIAYFLYKYQSMSSVFMVLMFFSAIVNGLRLANILLIL